MTPRTEYYEGDEKIADPMEKRVFYELCYAYRCTPITEPELVVARFEAIKAYCRNFIAKGAIWIPCAERMPDEEGRYLVVYQAKKGDWMVQRTYIGDTVWIDGKWQWASVPMHTDITHWQPIAPLPEALK